MEAKECISAIIGQCSIRLDIADIPLSRIRGQDRIEDTEPVPLCDEEVDKVITVVSR